MGHKKRKKPVPKTAGAVTPVLKRSLRNPSGRIRKQQEFLSQIDEHVKKAAKKVFRTNFLKEQKELAKLERKMRKLIKNNPGALSPRVRKRAIEILDEAYEIGEEFSTASRRIWKEVYKDPAARAIVDNARKSRVISFGKNKPNWARSGNAPRLKTRVKADLPVPLELDHWPPRERNPFKSFDADALQPITKEANVSFRREFASESAFPMGKQLKGPGKDVIEDFVQAHSLSRSQRPEGKTPEGTKGRNVKSFARPARDGPKSTAGKGTKGKGISDTLEATPDPKPAGTARSQNFRSGASGFTKRGAKKLVRVLGKAADVVSVDAVDLMTKPLKLGFISGLIVGLTVQIMLYVVEKRLAKVNGVGIAREYRDKVFNGITEKETGFTLAQMTQATINRIQTDWGDFEGIPKKRLKKYIYADYEYDVLMKIQANDPADVLVFFLKGLSFAEVYEDVNPVGNVSDVARDSPLSESAVMRVKRKMFSSKNLVRYRYTHKMLLYDPIVYQRYIDLWNWHIECKREFRDKAKRLSGDDKTRYIIHGRNVINLVTKYSFHEAVNYLNGDHEWLTYLGKIEDRSKRHLHGLKQLAKSGDQVVVKARKLQADRRVLLLMFAGHDVFNYRKKAKKSLGKIKRARLRDQLKKQRNSWRPAPGAGGRMY